MRSFNILAMERRLWNRPGGPAPVGRAKPATPSRADVLQREERQPSGKHATIASLVASSCRKLSVSAGAPPGLRQTSHTARPAPTPEPHLPLTGSGLAAGAADDPRAREGAFHCMTFDELNLAPAILKAVREQGYETPTPIQAQAIPAVLAGHDLLPGAQTGTGKTAAFTLPLLHKLSKGQGKPNK